MQISTKASGDLSAQAVIQNIKTGAVKGEDLDTEQRRRVVQWLILEGIHTDKAAELLGVCQATIYNDLKAVMKRMGEETTKTYVMEVAGLHAHRGEAIAAKLLRDGKQAQAWAVYRQIIQDLQSLGFIAKAPQRWINMNVPAQEDSNDA